MTLGCAMVYDVDEIMNLYIQMTMGDYLIFYCVVVAAITYTCAILLYTFPTSSDASVVLAMISCTCSIKLCLMKL